MSDHTDVMEFLLHIVRAISSSQIRDDPFQGADIDARDVCKRTALLLAALKSSTQSVCYLLSRNASLLYRDESDRNLLHFIIMQNLPIETIGDTLFRRDNFRLLFDQRDTDGYYPIHYASREGQVNMLTIIIRQGAEINKKTHQRQSSLHFAAQ
jgi:ankyrin repeat protein